jgi:hypothetical protein
LGEDDVAEIRTRHLMTVNFLIGGMQTIGVTPNGDRRVGLVGSGSFQGGRLRGRVLPGGSDWIIVRPDGAVTLDVRVVLETDDTALIGMTYHGLRHGPPSVIERLGRGEAVDPSEFYFRTSVAFETASAQYDWLNRIIAIGTGQRPPEGPIYDIFEVL